MALALLCGPFPLTSQGLEMSASSSEPSLLTLASPLITGKTESNSIAPDGAGITESDRMAAEAVKLVLENKLKEASEKINSALRLRVDRSYYHLINGLVYHLQARQGKSAAYDLAEQGYQRAINFDNSNWQAHFFAGMLSIDLSKFDKARQQLAEALIYHPKDIGLLNAFAYAAYRSGSPDLAAGAINGMEAIGGPHTDAELRNAALIMAAVGEKEKAQVYLDKLITAAGNARLNSHVEQRIAEWDNVYKQPQFIKTQSQGSFDGGASGFGGGTPGFGGGTPGFGGGTPAFGSAPAFGGGGMTGGAPTTAPGTESKMVVVDVVLISTEETFATEKGVNLLRGLQIQFGGANSSPAYSKTRTSNSALASSTTDITLALTIPAINYSLNIVNSNDQRNEILARPTLVAMAGRTSEFFSGEELNAVVANNSNSNSSPVNIQKEIGVTLSVTPSFLEDGRISLKVSAQRTFIKTPNTNLTGFSASVETAKSKVDASVVMRPGETLILGGLSEKEAQKGRDGVPLLQDIPLLQYLFSHSTSTDIQKSTLILITPRPPQYAYQPEKAQQEYEKSLSEDERPLANLRARYTDWFKPYPNWASVFHHLQENGLYREFRTGDVSMESWSDMRTLKDRLKSTLDFLYY
jgi:tetratricopeptide (TPR) repeat protein